MLVLSGPCIDHIQSSRFDELPSETLLKLEQAQVLVPMDQDELQLVITENNEEINKDEGTFYEVIQPSSNCQLGCYYCGQSHVKGEFSSALYDDLLLRMRDKIQKKKYSKMHIGWFGAEPLMALNTMRELTVKFKKLAAEFCMPYTARVVTNGMSLKAGIYRELVNELNVNAIEITLDGTQPFHDQHRYTKTGGGSFDIITSNLLDIIKKEYNNECRLSIRCNVDEKNFKGVAPLIQWLSDHELQNKISFYTVGVYSWGNDAHKRSLTKEQFAKEEIKWIAQMLKFGIQPRLIPKRVKQVCMAVSKTSEMYDGKGNIFNCTEVSYVPSYEKSDYVLGRLGSPENNTKQRPLVDWNLDILSGKFPCHSCRLLPVCGRACPKSWHEDMRACPSAKFNIEDRLKLAYIVNKNRFGEDLHEKLMAFSEQPIVEV